MKMFSRASAILFLAFLCLPGPARGSEQMRSAAALEAGKLAVSVYGARVEHKDLEFHLKGADLIQVPLKGGGTAQFFSNSDTDLQFDGEGTAAYVRLTWRPFDGLHYGFRLGAGDYELRVPSGSVVNTLENGRAGRIWGADLGWTFLNNTPVSPALALSLGYMRSDYGMTRLVSGANAPVSVDQEFVLEEWQAGLSASKRWKVLEPYAGVRFFRQSSLLRDNATAERVRGTRDGFSPYGGLRWEFLPREALTLEAAGVDEVVVAAGVSIGF